uniref:NADH-ubiquinone oxidoreductase chain 2 n=1 Tax=Pseudocrangonyx daejeonensis TaxID=2038767 RepID=A0A346SAG6_9CRUS|nr:NADH dehydrogenase subunit 2 [Pseudocrangonyx daejeonensis]AXT17554.1 NADH dehydrogenase subunit 2 [Pseudocrangonyx daejeonensis]
MIILALPWFILSSSLLLSILLLMSSSSWFMIWLSLEVNLLTFIPLMLKSQNKYNTESIIKYFLIQASASIFIIMPVLFHPLHTPTVYMLITMALMLKVAAAPTHQWMPALIEGLSWPTAFTLMTIQKIGPMLLIPIFFNKSILYLYLFSSILVGSLGGFNQLNLRKILAYSSISHMSWFITAMTVSTPLWWIYFFTYSMILSTISLTFYLLNADNMPSTFLYSDSTSNIIFSLSFLSLAGLPPFSGFIPKLMVIQQLTELNSYFLPMILIMGTFISLFFYIRMLYSYLFIFSSTTSFTMNPLKFSTILDFINTVGLLSVPLLFIMT